LSFAESAWATTTAAALSCGAAEAGARSTSSPVAAIGHSVRIGKGKAEIGADSCRANGHSLRAVRLMLGPPQAIALIRLMKAKSPQNAATVGRSDQSDEYG
jgi:hypothetical protein